jgi:hypothetical protein
MHFKGDSVRDCSDCKLICGEHSGKVQSISDLSVGQAQTNKDIEFLKKEVSNMKTEQSEVVKGLIGVRESMNKATLAASVITGLLGFLYTFHDPITKLLGLVK